MPGSFKGRLSEKIRKYSKQSLCLLIPSVLRLKLENPASEKTYIKIRFYAH
jgi:hypothetical protein